KPFIFFSSRRRHTRFSRDWSSDVCSSDLRILKGTVFNKYKQFINNCFELLPRQALHAKSLGFVHPRTKEEMYFETPLPSDFEAILEKWRSYITSVDR